MSQKFYVDGNGNFICSTVDAIDPPEEGWIEVPYGPKDSKQVWSGTEWNAVVPEIPESITSRQGKLKLIELGLLTQLESLIDQIADPKEKLKLQVEYNNHVWERSNPWIDLMGAELSLTPAQIDQLFIEAKEIT